MTFILNGARNYELLSRYLSELIIQHIPQFSGMVHTERYNDFDRSDYPAINVVLDSVNPIQRDSVSSMHTCGITILVLDETVNKGVGNSSETKRNVMSIVGKIDNFLCKQLNYYLKYEGRVIGTFDAPSINFTSQQTFNASGVVGASLSTNFAIVENNENLFEDILKEMAAKANKYNWDKD